MANIEMKALYGYNFDNNDGFSIQLHLTTACDQNCKHCYMYNSALYSEQKKKALEKEEWISLIKEIDEFSKKYAVRCLVAITGGDPILSSCFWEILEYLSTCELLDVVIMGNSYHIDIDVVKKMKRLGVKSYQISLDGLEKRHDSIRKKGSFKDALRALEIIHQGGIIATVLLTVLKSNYNEVIPLYTFLDSLEFVDIFSFDKMIPIGNAKDKEEFLTGDEYHRLLFEFYKSLTVNNYKLNFSFKDNMWKLLFYDIGLIDPFEDRKQIIGGCSALNSSISILSNGEVLPCRKMEVNIGKYPEKKFEEILIKNEMKNSMMNIDSFIGCRECVLKAYCRGCLALSYAVNGDMFSKDIYCWRINNNV